MQFQCVVVVLSLASRPDNFLKVLHLIDVSDDSSDLLELLNSIENVETLEDMVFLHFIEDFKEDVLVRGDDGLWDFVSLVKQLFRDLHDIIDRIFIVLKEGEGKGSKAIIEGEPVVRDDQPLPVL